MTDEPRDVLVIHPWPFREFHGGFARAVDARCFRFSSRPRHAGPLAFVGTDANNFGAGEVYAVVALLGGCARTEDGMGVVFTSVERFTCPIIVNGTFQARPDLRGDVLGFVGDFSYLTRSALERIPAEARALAALAETLR